MVLMINGKRKKFVPDALVAAYKAKGFTVPGEAVTSEPEPESAVEEGTDQNADGEATAEAEEATATTRKTSRKKKQEV